MRPHAVLLGCTAPARPPARQHPKPACLCPAAPQDDLEMEVDSWLRRKFEGSVREVEIVHREDLDLVGCDWALPLPGRAFCCAGSPLGAPSSACGEGRCEGARVYAGRAWAWREGQQGGGGGGGVRPVMDAAAPVSIPCCSAWPPPPALPVPACKWITKVAPSAERRTQPVMQGLHCHPSTPSFSTPRPCLARRPLPLPLPQKNHLSGIQRKLLKISFWNQEQLQQVREGWAGQIPGGDAWLYACCARCRLRARPCRAPRFPPAPVCPRSLFHPSAPQVRREISPIVSRNRYRRDGISAYQVLQQQQGPTGAKAGKERLQVGGRARVCCCRWCL